MPLVSIREYARMRGISHEGVRKAINEKRLINSVIQQEQGKRKLALIDSDIADQEWPKGTRESFAQEAPNARQERINDDNKVGQTYTQSRAVREAYAARLAKLEFEAKSGKLIEAESVREEAFKVARVVRDTMLNIPDRIASELVGEVDSFKIHKKLTEEIRKALENLSFEEE